MPRRFRRIGVCLFALLTASWAVQAAGPRQQTSPTQAPQRPTFVTRIDTVSVDVIVTDKDGRTVTDIEQLDREGRIVELAQMLGGETGQSMQQLRESAAKGEGQMRATMDIAKEVGSGIARQQEMRKARGKMLFDQYKQKMGMVQPEAAKTAEAAPAPERQKIAE